MKMETLKKYILVAAVSFIILLTIVGIIIYQNFSKGRLTLTISPSDASYKISNKTYVGNIEKLELPAGKYEIVFFRSGFTSLKKSLTVAGAKETSHYIVMKPLVVLPEYDAFSETDKIEAADNALSDLQNIAFQKSYPLAQYLPYLDNSFTIDFRADGDKVITELTITPNEFYTEEEAKSKAFSWIKSHGVNVSNLQIDYKVL